jgi:osmotically-inducible protein OsmY
MITDVNIKQDVLNKLKMQPIIDATQVGVTVDHGNITLMGVVNNLVEKVAAEKLAKRVKGVKVVVDNIIVKNEKSLSDTEITKKIIFDLEWDLCVPQEEIKVKVKDGHVFLSGKVNWPFQKNAAKRSLEYIEGVKSITNNISILEKLTQVNVD